MTAKVDPNSGNITEYHTAVKARTTASYDKHSILESHTKTQEET
jgi:hypothetical protein